ncbi:quinone-dependent dihydroorotate dehydrogenase, partial [Alphaproteobacteria bacterium]|nr:quinone-dependent dihydroorotate dehydrogenase [Alphaproteobacteria bacterium]
PNLRDFHETKHLKKVIMSVKNGILKSKSSNLEVPVFLKIAPDITSNDLESIIKISSQKKITGLIISNTTIDREINLKSPNLKEFGGLSGAPLFLKSTKLLSLANQIIKKNNYKLHLIAAGGVSDCQSAYTKILCGAHLIQLYTSMTYEGPFVANKIIKGLLLLMKRDNITNINDIRGIVKNPETAMKIAINGFK